jgi:hypothetical protein
MYHSTGVQKLSETQKSKLRNEYIKPIEGEGIIGDVLKGLISMTGLGAKKKRGRPRKTTTTKKGKGVLTSLIKAVAPAVIDAAAGAAKGKVSGMGAKRKPGRPRKVGRPKGPSKKTPGRPRKKRSGGVLIVPGYSVGQLINYYNLFSKLY